MKCIMAKAMVSSLNITENVDYDLSLRDIKEKLQLIQI